MDELPGGSTQKIGTSQGPGVQVCESNARQNRYERTDGKGEMDEILQLLLVALGLFVLPAGLQSIGTVRSLYSAGRLSARGIWRIRAAGAICGLLAIFARYPASSTLWIIGVPFSGGYIERMGDIWFEQSGPITYLIVGVNVLVWYSVPYLLFCIVTHTSSGASSFNE